jgi:hypothetical protein
MTITQITPIVQIGAFSYEMFETCGLASEVAEYTEETWSSDFRV